MSEPIQSISNGTYMIGETTQTELQAGPGISITKPSEGTVRIAADETVLWENSSGSTSSVSLSESPYNFDFVEIYAGSKNGNYTSGPVVYRLSLINNPSVFCVGASYLVSSSVNAVGLKFTLSSTSVSQQMTSTSTQAVIYKVVGVNRISGGNA